MRSIIFHHNDADGRCAAFIIARWIKWGVHISKVVFVEMDYKDPVPVEIIEPEDWVAIVDFSFKPDVMAKIHKITSSVTWCDHHVTAKDYGYEGLPGVRDFSVKGKCGAECAWSYSFGKLLYPPALRLLGDYDSWRLEEPQESLPFYEGLKLEETDPACELSIWPKLLFDEDKECYTAKITDNGRIAMRYRDNYCAKMSKGYGFETSIHGHKAFALNVYAMGNAGVPMEIRKNYPITIAYIHDGSVFTVSLYSEGVDVSEIAKVEGGGGHKEAAGFVCHNLPFKPE